MYTDMQQWAEIRRRVLNGELSKRAACREYEIHWDTLQKILSHVEPPGYRRTKPRSSKIDRYVPIIHQILRDDRQVHPKQRHTAKKIFERLREEHDYEGGITLVQEVVREWKGHPQEVFLPLSHHPGEAQVDFGFADAYLQGTLTKICLFVMTLPYSDAQCLVTAQVTNTACRHFPGNVRKPFWKVTNEPLTVGDGWLRTRDYSMEVSFCTLGVIIKPASLVRWCARPDQL